jgi:hypothetical protein
MKKVCMRNLAHVGHDSRRVVEDAIDRSKINTRSTWSELIPQDDASVSYPSPQCSKGKQGTPPSKKA